MSFLFLFPLSFFVLFLHIVVDFIEFLFLPSKILATSSETSVSLLHFKIVIFSPFSATDVTLLLTFLTYASHEHVPTEVMNGSLTLLQYLHTFCIDYRASP